MSLQYTQLEQIPQIVSKLHKNFHKHDKLDSVAYRLKQLRILYSAIHSNEDALCEAVKADLNRPIQDTKFLEFHVFYAEILDVIANLENWLKPEHVKSSDIPFIIRFTGPKVEKISLGTILIISPYNVPTLLALQPLIGAIAGGNTIVLKQSELVPNTSALLSKILTNVLDPEWFQVVNGGIDETTVLLEQKFDKILYTGSSAVGRIIAKAGAKNLTPSVLELGGKTPVFIGESVRPYLGVVCNRLLFTKFMNAGQLCVAADYAIVEDKIYDEFCSTLIEVTKELYDGANEENFTHIVHNRSWERLYSMIKESKGKIIFGGKNHNGRVNYIEPTILKDVTFQDSTMTSEIFGPILPIIKFSNLEKTLNQIISQHDTPLAMYIYSHSDSQINQIKTSIRSGALIINDGMLHVATHALPFGGIGESGYGSYHGIHSVKTFTHERATMQHPFWCDWFWKDKFRSVRESHLWRGSKYLPKLPGHAVPWDSNGEINIGSSITGNIVKYGLIGSVVAAAFYHYVDFQ